MNLEVPPVVVRNWSHRYSSTVSRQDDDLRELGFGDYPFLGVRNGHLPYAKAAAGDFLLSGRLAG
jgi:hypothetical protein